MPKPEARGEESLLWLPADDFNASSALGVTARRWSGISRAVKPTYPLEPVEKLREARTDAQALEVSRAERRVLEARAEEALAEEALLRARAAREALEMEERTRLETTLVRAVDLERSFQFTERGRIEEGRLETKRLLMHRRVNQAEQVKSGALAALASAHAELSAVEQHHTRWARAREREQQEKEQEAAQEQWNNERSRRSGP